MMNAAKARSRHKINGANENARCLTFGRAAHIHYGGILTIALFGLAGIRVAPPMAR